MEQVSEIVAGVFYLSADVDTEDNRKFFQCEDMKLIVSIGSCQCS